MQGFTDVAYRSAHADVIGGVEQYGVPFLRLEHGEVRKRDIRDLQNLSHNTTPQIIANGLEEFLTLANIIANLGYKHIDLNLGCPFPMQMRHGRGVALMNRTEELQAIVGAMQTMNEKQQLTFSIKMRLGAEQPSEWLNIIHIINNAPLRYVTMHPRIATQQYKGNVDMNAFRNFYQRCNIPIIYNGDLTTTEQIQAIAHEFPHLHAIMIGRGLLSRPTLAYEYANNINYDNTTVANTMLQIHNRVLSHYEQTLEGGEAQVLQKILPIWEYAQPLFDRKLIKRLKKAHSLSDYKTIVRQM